MLRAPEGPHAESRSREARSQPHHGRVRGLSAAGLPGAGDEVPVRARDLRRGPGALALRRRALGAAPSGDLLLRDGDAHGARHRAPDDPAADRSAGADQVPEDPRPALLEEAHAGNRAERAAERARADRRLLRPRRVRVRQRVRDAAAGDRLPRADGPAAVGAGSLPAHQGHDHPPADADGEPDARGRPGAAQGRGPSDLRVLRRRDRRAQRRSPAPTW